VLALLGVIGLLVNGLSKGTGSEGQALAAGASSAASTRPSASAPRLATASASAASAANAFESATTASAPAASFLTAADLPRLFKTLTRSEKDAWRELAPAWQLALGDGDPCTQALRAQVPCFRSSGSTLALIRQLDRPGILMLNDDSGQPVYALLTGLGPQSATLRIGDVSKTVSLVSLATLWRGDFATFWRAPPGYAGRVIDAGSGEPASWLAERLATLRGEAAPPDDALSAAGWRTRLAAFQLAQGLKPDGLAGPTTFMQLNRATGVKEPRRTRTNRCRTSSMRCARPNRNASAAACRASMRRSASVAARCQARMARRDAARRGSAC
jgi:general secretion pathway protein A